MAEMLAFAFVLILVAAAAQAVTGFGFVMVAVPLLALLVDARTAVVACVALGLVLTSIGWFRDRAQVSWRPVVAIAGGALIGIPIGLSVFTALSQQALTLVIGVVVLAFTVLLTFRVRVPGGVRTEFVAGAVSGGMLATTGMNGPPMVLALQAADLPPLVTRATLQAAFTLQSIVAVSGLALAGQFARTSLAVLAVGTPALWIGWAVGDRFFRRLPAERVRAIVLVTLAISGLLMVRSAIATG